MIIIEILTQTHSLAQVVLQPTSNEISIINEVNSFYESAWNKLLLGGGLLITFVGILLPFISYYFQRQSFKIAEKAIADSILKELYPDIENFIKDTIDSKLENVYRNISFISGNYFYSQGLYFMDKEDYYTAFSQFLTASTDYIKADDHGLLMRCLSHLKNDVLPNLEDYDILNEHLLLNGKNIELLVDMIKEHQLQDLTDDHIMAILVGLDKITK